MATLATQEIPHLPWSEFLEEFDWRQGEHISLVGPTGQGKTTLGIELLDRRQYVLAFGTKPRDETLERLRDEKGYAMSRESLYPIELAPRQLFWPKTETVEDVAKHRGKFKRVLSTVYTEGGWTIFPDELLYFTHNRYLGLSAYFELFWLQGRSNYISLIGGTQRPFHVPLSAFNAPTHLFLWRDSDNRNLARLREISGNVDRRLIHREILALDAKNHEVLYVNTRTGDIMRTRAEVNSNGA